MKVRFYEPVRMLGQKADSDSEMVQQEELGLILIILWCIVVGGLWISFSGLIKSNRNFI